MIPIDTTRMGQRLSPLTARTVWAADQTWSVWDVCAVSGRIVQLADSMPLLARQQAPTEPGVQLAATIEQALAAPRIEMDHPGAAQIGIDWWAAPLARRGGRANRIAMVKADGRLRPVVLVVDGSGVVGLIGGSLSRARDVWSKTVIKVGVGPVPAPDARIVGRMVDHPSHHIDGTPWGRGADPSGQRFSTPFDGDGGRA